MSLRWETLTLVVPELILIVSATLIMVGGAFWRSRSAWTSLSVLAILAAAVTLTPTMQSFQQPALDAVEGPFLLDPLAISGRYLALVVGAILVLVHARRGAELQGGELPGLLLMLTAGLALVGFSANLALMFVSLELISIPTYVLLFIGRNCRESAEGAVKYFLLSVLSSAVFLLGVSFLFAVVGTLDLTGVPAAVADADPSTRRMLAVAMGLIVFGLGFKLAAVPCHFYAPDVYQATTNANAGLLAVVPKVAGILTLIRLAGLGLVGAPTLGWQTAIVVAVLSMTLGNLAALWQSNLRRMLAYSSIAHAGYLLIGVAVGAASDISVEDGGFNGWSASLLYLAVYSLASLGAFAVFAELSSEAEETSQLSEIQGLAHRRPILAGVLAVCMFSLAGLPPLAGFWGKFELIAGALQTSSRSDSDGIGRWFLVLAIIAMVNAAIAATYYLRIIATAYFGVEREVGPTQGGNVLVSGDPQLRGQASTINDGAEFGVPGLAGAFAAVAILCIGLFPGLFVGRARFIGQHVTPSSVSENAEPRASVVVPDNRTMPSFFVSH